MNNPFISTVAGNTNTNANTMENRGEGYKVPGQSTVPFESTVSNSEKAVATWSNAQEAREAFESLLAEVIKTPSMSWKDAVPRLTRDIRFTVMAGYFSD